LIKSGSNFVDIRAGDLAQSLKVENSICCGAMARLFQAGDRIIELPSGRLTRPGETFAQQTGEQNHQGANLVIRYVCNKMRGFR
jgi:hypothetical protein